MLDERALLDGSIRDGLGRDGLASSTALVRGDENARLAVLDTVAEGLCREAGEDDGVDGANSRAGEERRDGVPGHGQIDGDGVALLDSP